MTTASIGIPFITNDCSGVPIATRSTCFLEKRSWNWSGSGMVHSQTQRCKPG